MPMEPMFANQIETWMQDHGIGFKAEICNDENCAMYHERCGEHFRIHPVNERAFLAWKAKSGKGEDVPEAYAVRW